MLKASDSIWAPYVKCGMRIVQVNSTVNDTELGPRL